MGLSNLIVSNKPLGDQVGKGDGKLDQVYPNNLSNNYYIFKESDTEKLAVSMEMLKQLKGNVPNNSYVSGGKKKDKSFVGA